MKEPEKDMQNKVITEDKEIKNKEAKVLEKTNIPDPIEKDKNKEDHMMTDTDIHNEKIEKICREEDKETGKPKEAEAEKKQNLTEETDINQTQLEDKGIATKERILEAAKALEVLRDIEMKIEKENIHDLKIEK